jgi:outer membrane protein OmpA-like peptidoglycan-associated protein
MKKLLLLCFFVLSYIKINAQINVYYPDVDDWVRKNFTGQGLIIGNITHKGNNDAIGSFTSSPNVLKITNGLMISTGEAVNAIGPNDRYNVSKDFETTIEHDKDLKALEKGNLYDVSLIEFDFVSFHNSIKFNYQFASDEYPEYVGSSFNDIFAFFISDGKKNKNIAVVPGTNIPVSINTINNKVESKLFINNNVFVNDISKKTNGTSSNYQEKVPKKLWKGIKNVFSKTDANAPSEYEPDEELLKNVNEDLYHFLQYDGITQKLTAQTYVEPYKRYHLKIIIADVDDNVYDSAVFLETRSLTAVKDKQQPGFKDYPDYSKIIDPKHILNGKLLEDILPQQVEIPNTNIYFDFDKIEVPTKEMEKVKLLANTFDKIKNNYRIEITGNTDSIGTYDYNFKLSKTRSQVVIGLLQYAIPDFKFDKVEYKSYTEPSSSNTTEDGRKLNRRVSIKFIRIKK